MEGARRGEEREEGGEERSGVGRDGAMEMECPYHRSKNIEYLAAAAELNRDHNGGGMGWG